MSRLLERGGATEEDLHCGPVEGSRLRHNCSGKHSGMMLLARLAGIPFEGYWRVEHEVQQRVQSTLREFTSCTEPLAWGIDGCGVPNYPRRSLASVHQSLWKAAGRAINDRESEAVTEIHDDTVAIALSGSPGLSGGDHEIPSEPAHGNNRTR